MHLLRLRLVRVAQAVSLAASACQLLCVTAAAPVASWLVIQAVQVRLQPSEFLGLAELAVVLRRLPSRSAVHPRRMVRTHSCRLHCSGALWTNREVVWRLHLQLLAKAEGLAAARVPQVVQHEAVRPQSQARRSRQAACLSCLRWHRLVSAAAAAAAAELLQRSLPVAEAALHLLRYISSPTASQSQHEATRAPPCCQQLELQRILLSQERVNVGTKPKAKAAHLAVPRVWSAAVQQAAPGQQVDEGGQRRRLQRSARQLLRRCCSCQALCGSRDVEIQLV